MIYRVDITLLHFFSPLESGFGLLVLIFGPPVFIYLILRIQSNGPNPAKVPRGAFLIRQNRIEHVVANEGSTDTKRCACCFRINLWLFTFLCKEIWKKKLYVFNAMSLQISLNVVRYHKRLLLLCSGRHLRELHTSIYQNFPRGAPKPDPSLKLLSTGDNQA